MKLEFDLREFHEFADRLSDTYELETRLMTATQEITKVLHKYLLSQTPIKTGNLRKMWSAGDNLAFTVEKVQNGFQVTLINLAQTDKGFKYGLAVNDGHKTPSGNGWVMGRFFVEKSILLTANSTQVETIIMEQLQKWWDGV